MNTNKSKRSAKNGGILLVVVFVLLTVTVLVMGMLMLQQTGGVEVITSRQSKQAFWLAEAGVQSAIQKLNWQAAYRNNPTNFNASLGKGTFQVSVVNNGTDIFSTIIGKTNYTIRAVGRVKGMNRRIEQKVSTIPGSKFVITSVGMGGGTCTFSSNAEINGGIAVFGGAIDTGNNATVILGDNLFVGDSVTVSGSGDYREAPMPSDLQQPSFDPTGFQTEYGTVVARGTPTGTYVEPSAALAGGEIDYTSNNVVFASAVEVPANTVIKSYGDLTFASGAVFNGPVTIEAGGKVTFVSSTDLPDDTTIIAGKTVQVKGSISIGNGVEIISGENISFGNQLSFASRSMFYAEQDLTVASGASSSVSGEGIAFLSNGNVILSSNFNAYRGIIYANGMAELNSNMDIYGTVVGGQGLDITSNVDFHYDPLAYNWILNKANIDVGLYDAVLTKEKWTELPPL